MFNKLKNIGGAASSLSDLVGSVKTVADSFSGSPKAAVSTQAAASTPKANSKYSPELDEMIAMVIEDDAITERDIELLSNRAAKEGVDPDEFEFDMRMRLKKRARMTEERKNMNPVVGLSQAFNMLEQYAKGGEKVVDPGTLSGVLSMIPGVGPLAAAGGLLASFIETPSNLNQLKAEAIRRFVLPDNPEHLVQFINYAASQQTQTELEKTSKLSLKSMLSSIAMGSDIDLGPIWEKKLEEACEKAQVMYPADPLVVQTAKKYRPTLLKKLQAGYVGPIAIPGHCTGLNDVTAPADDNDLLDVVEFAFAKKSSDDWEDWKAFHGRMYKEAEARLAGNPAALSRLSRYKVKKFGLF